MNKILVDTNVVRRMMEFNNGNLYDENSKGIINKLIKVFNFNRIYISDKSLFEIVDYISRKKYDKNIDFNCLTNILKKYNFGIVYHDSTKTLYDNWDSVVNGNIEIDIVKKMCFNSFADSLFKFVIQICKYLSLNIFKISASKDYTKDWYLEGSVCIESNEYYEYFKNIFYKDINESYFNNDVKIKTIIDELLKESIIWSVAFIKLYESNEERNEKNFEKYFSFLMNSVVNENYFELLDLKSDAIDVVELNKCDDADDLTFIYSKEVFLNVIKHIKKVKINDIVDFSNFKIAYEHNLLYLTLDKKSINSYKKTFSKRKEIIQYINNCENIIS